MADSESATSAQAGDATGQGAQDRLVVQGHLDALVGVLVVHEVHAVERVDVGLGEPVHRLVELGCDVVVVQDVTGDGGRAGETCLPLISSRPPLIAYSSVLARLTRAPKNCICLPTRMADTQQAIAASSPHEPRMRSSDSYWMAEVSMETLAQNFLKPSGSLSLHSTVRFGSGAGPRL